MTEEEALESVINRWEQAAVHDDPRLYLAQNKCALCEIHNPCVKCILFGKGICTALVGWAMFHLWWSRVNDFRVIADKIVERLKNETTSTTETQTSSNKTDTKRRSA